MNWNDVLTKFGEYIPTKPEDSRVYAKVVLHTFYRDYPHADRVLSAISNEIAGSVQPTNEGASSLSGSARYHITLEGRLTGAQVKEYLVTVVNGGGEIYEVLL